MKRINTISLTTLMTLAIWCLGCEDNPKVEILSIYPADGATNVAKTTEITVEYSYPMDKMSCESRFALISGHLSEMPGDFNDGMHGTFEWDSENSMMTFYPDSVLMDSVMYSICLKEGMEMHGSGGEMMMSGMNGHGTSATGGIISKFETQE